MQMHLNFITFYICFLASAKRPFHFRECRIVQLFVLFLEIIQVSDSIAWVRCDFFNQEAFLTHIGDDFDGEFGGEFSGH